MNKLKWAKYMLTIFHHCYHRGKSDHYAVTNLHLGIFLTLIDMISSKQAARLLQPHEVHISINSQKNFELCYTFNDKISIFERTLPLHSSL